MSDPVTNPAPPGVPMNPENLVSVSGNTTEPAPEPPKSNFPANTMNEISSHLNNGVVEEPQVENPITENAMSKKKLCPKKKKFQASGVQGKFF